MRFDHPRDFLARFKWYLLAAVVCVALAAAAFWSKDKTQTRYSTAEVSRGSIENLVTATGILQPREYVDVGAQVSGQLKVLHVVVGSEVKQGDLLAEIDAKVYVAKVDGIRAQLRNLRAQLQDREAQLKLARITHQRQINLQKEDATTQEELQSAEASLQSARAQLESLKAQLEQTESSLRAEEANLEYSRIYAPMSGTVVSITSRQGQTLNANQIAPTLLRIADLSTMTVQAQVSEADVSRLKPDMPVYFTTFGSGGKRWHSTLARIEPTPTVLNNVVLYNALFDVPNPDGALMTQMTTQVFFVAAEARDVWQVPVAALVFGKGGPEQAGRRAGGERRSAEVGALSEGAAGDRSRRERGERPEAGARGERPNIDSSGETGRGGKGRDGRRRGGSVAEGAARTATVKVLLDGDRVEERQVSIGVTNRVRAQVLAGLAEGDQVVLGDAASAQQQNNNRGWGGGGMRMMR